MEKIEGEVEALRSQFATSKKGEGEYDIATLPLGYAGYQLTPYQKKSLRQDDYAAMGGYFKPLYRRYFKEPNC